MAENKFIWTEELTLMMLKLKFENESLFKIQKQPWAEFHKILINHGFPSEVSHRRVVKKWGYVFDLYKIAKKENNTSWKYYDIFDKHYGKKNELGKYESWPTEWRSKLITCISAAKSQNLEHDVMWKTIERSMRCQDMPRDCCVHDMQGLWQNLKMIFLRNRRLMIKKGLKTCDWPLYDQMYAYYTMHDPSVLKPQHLICSNKIGGTNSYNIPTIEETFNTSLDSNTNVKEKEFIWTKDISESFIQIRLRNDWLFNQRLQAWKDFVIILKDEYGFPQNMTTRDARSKWNCIFASYQKAKATKNTSWLYYNLFELYLGEGTPSINPMFDWQEKWALKLIEARTSCEELFLSKAYRGSPSKCWREVEKRLRSDGIPLDYSLLELNNVWSYLIRTFKFKKKFANKGVLKEQWPYYEAMENYYVVHNELATKENESIKEKDEGIFGNEITVDDNYDDDDDIKLFDLKKKIESESSKIDVNPCRACGLNNACVNIFQKQEGDDLDIASKLSLLGGVMVEESDQLPDQICNDCLQELQNAYKFRRKCEMTDRQFRLSAPNVKIEVTDETQRNAMDDHDTPRDDFEDSKMDYTNTDKDVKQEKKKEKVKLEHKKPGPKPRYVYKSVCEICGAHTKNLKNHMDTHNTEKRYACTVCGKAFKFKSGLSLHRSVHSGAVKKTCDVCGKTFHCLSYFRKHYMYHANERKFACETCGRRFNSMDTLKVHNKIHTGERPFFCSECGKSFRTAGCVTRHKRIVHRSIKSNV